MQKVRLQCENEIIEVDLEVAQQSVILKNMIEHTGKDGEIPLPKLGWSHKKFLPKMIRIF